MITPSALIDLGKDRARMSDSREVARQNATVARLLERYFDPDIERRQAFQLVADEVGMGKTFVALATAFTMLESIRSGTAPSDLAGCVPKVLVVTPVNASLSKKWARELGEFCRRCAKDETSASWFKPIVVENWDELVYTLDDPDGPPAIVLRTTLLSRSSFKQVHAKRAYVLAMLFNFWGNAIRNDVRDRLLKVAPDEYCGTAEALKTWARGHDELFFRADFAATLQRNADLGARSTALLADCREAAMIHLLERRREAFELIGKQLSEMYAALCHDAVRSTTARVPLVIVDEAHNWKNGPSAGSNGYKTFVETVAPRCARALLLTATPFQLRPEEMLELLQVGEHLSPSANVDERPAWRERMRKTREGDISPVLQHSEQASRSLAQVWSKLPREVDTESMLAAWSTPQLESCRAQLREMGDAVGAVSSQRVEQAVEGAVVGLDPHVRAFFRHALALYAFNHDLSAELSRLVIRHRRKTGHRAFLVGAEIERGVAAASRRPDRHVLHGAAGMDVRGDAELPHYLLMRAVTELNQGQSKSALGDSLTGCYSTLLHSADGKSLRDPTRSSPLAKVYVDLLASMVGEPQDPGHPKLARVVESVLDAWRRGDKSLIFCMRVQTAKRVRQIISDRVQAELDARCAAFFGGPKAFHNFRVRLTSRERDLVGLTLDRVLLSAYWAAARRHQLPFEADALELHEYELRELAVLLVRYDADLDDRVFLNRATEYVLARRLLRHPATDAGVRPLLERAADPQWIELPYGEDPSTTASDDDGDGLTGGERGLHSRYRTVVPTPRDEQVAPVLATLSKRDGILTAYAQAPSFWFGPDPAALEPGEPAFLCVRMIALSLARLTTTDGVLELRARMRVMQALRKAVLREPTLLRLLPATAETDDLDWADILPRAFFQPAPGRAESLADHLKIFLEDLVAASGRMDDAVSSRRDMLDATKLRDQQTVALVTGATDAQTRERAFMGFNSPLLPEILVCTSVGAEGIDLHRYCRHVYHYDLAWNPALLEQRTGRTDRIGSKALRERQQSGDADALFLEINVPYLAGTYDERMYEQLRRRAQTFEVLTGGDLAADSPAEDADDASQAGTDDPRLDRLVSLPAKMVDDLRVKLHVYAG